jgi:hypothetical protein
VGRVWIRCSSVLSPVESPALSRSFSQDLSPHLHCLSDGSVWVSMGEAPQTHQIPKVSHHSLLAPRKTQSFFPWAKGPLHARRPSSQQCETLLTPPLSSTQPLCPIAHTQSVSFSPHTPSHHSQGNPTTAISKRWLKRVPQSLSCFF